MGHLRGTKLFLLPEAKLHELYRSHHYPILLGV